MLFYCKFSQTADIKTYALSFCPHKIIFVQDKIIFVKNKFKIVSEDFFFLDKKYCPRLKSSYLLGKRIENDFLVVEKFLSVAKKSYSIHFTSKYALF